MPALTLTLRSDLHRRPELEQTVQDVVACTSALVLYGGYSSTPREVPIVAAAMLAGGSGSLQVDAPAPLFGFDRPPFRHLLNALRYRFLAAQLPVSMHLDEMGPVSRPEQASGIDDELPELPFPADVCWGHRRVSLILEFTNELDPRLADELDARINTWARFTRCGAYFAQDQGSEFDEDTDVGVYADPPCVGHDFAEWSLLSIGVPQEAVRTLANILLHSSAARRQISAMLIG